MRYLLFVVLFISTLNVTAQSPAVSNLFAEGTKHAKAGKFDDAVKSYKTALSMAENEYIGAGYRAQLHYNIGVCHLRMDRLDLARNHFKSALILKGDYKAAYHALSLTKSRDREWKSRTASL